MKQLALALLLLTSVPLSAQSVPTGMTYQGRLTDANNVAAADGTGYEIEVRLYNTPVPGPTQVLLWGTRYSEVPIKSGAFNIILGTGGTPIPGAATTDLKAAFNTSTIHLGLTPTKSANGAAIPASSEILPRQQIFSSPYAFRAETTASVQPDGVLSTAIKDGEIKTADIGALQVGNNQIADGSINSAKITDGSIQAIDIAPMGVAQDRIANEFAMFVDERPTGVEAGLTNSTSWTQRVLNKTTASLGNSATLAGNIITLKTGIYRVQGSAPTYSCQRHHAVIRRSGTTEIVIRGTSEHNYNNTTHSYINGMITVTAATESFELWHYTEDGGRPFGIPSNAAGSPEIYSSIQITRIK